MNERNDNGYSAAILILSIAGIGGLVLGLWLYQWMTILTK